MPIPSMFFGAELHLEQVFGANKGIWAHTLWLFQEAFLLVSTAWFVVRSPPRAINSIGLRLFPVTQYSIASLLKIIMWVFCRLQAVLGIL